MTGQLLKGISIKDVINHKSRHARLASHKPLVYVAAMPKAAGTFICKTIADTHRIPLPSATIVRGCCEFDIYHPNFT